MALALKTEKALCTEKLILLDQYVSQLASQNHDVRDYAACVAAGLNGDALNPQRERLVQSKERFREARKRYTDHLHQHGC